MTGKPGAGAPGGFSASLCSQHNPLSSVISCLERAVLVLRIGGFGWDVVAGFLVGRLFPCSVGWHVSCSIHGQDCI